MIPRMRHFVPPSTYIYRSLIQPYSLYAIVAWGNAAKIDRTKILTLQKQALCLIYFGDCKSHAIPVFISSHLNSSFRYAPF